MGTSWVWGLQCPPLPLHLASPKPLSAAQVCCCWLFYRPSAPKAQRIFTAGSSAARFHERRLLQQTWMSDAFTSARIDGKIKPVESGEEDQYYLDKTLHLWQETTDSSFDNEPGFGETAVFPATEQREPDSRAQLDDQDSDYPEPSTERSATANAPAPASASTDRSVEVQREVETALSKAWVPSSVGPGQMRFRRPAMTPSAGGVRRSLRVPAHWGSYIPS